jgi:hypothetical protein
MDTWSCRNTFICSSPNRRWRSFDGEEGDQTAVCTASEPAAKTTGPGADRALGLYSRPGLAGAAEIPTLNFAKNAKFRMGHPASPLQNEKRRPFQNKSGRPFKPKRRSSKTKAARLQNSRAPSAQKPCDQARGTGFARLDGSETRRYTCHVSRQRVNLEGVTKTKINRRATG